MINKRGLWFLTLFSLILVLGVYYITMPSEMFLTTNSDYNEKKEDKKDDEGSNVVVNIKESEILSALRATANEEMLKELKELKVILTNSDTSIEEKNNAFNKMKEINANRGLEEKVEKKIEEEFKLKAFVKITGNQIRVVVASDKHDNTLANNIMRSVQSEFENKMYISVKFQK